MANTVPYDPTKASHHYYNSPYETNYPISPAMQEKIAEDKNAQLTPEDQAILNEHFGVSNITQDDQAMLDKHFGITTNPNEGSVSINVIAKIKDVADSKIKIIDGQIESATDDKTKDILKAKKSEVELAKEIAIYKQQKEEPKTIKSYFDVSGWFNSLPSRIGLEAQGLYYGAGEALTKLEAVPKEAAAWALQLTGNEDKANQVRNEIQGALDIWGGKIAQVKAERIKQFGGESWGMGEGVGQMAPELAVKTVRTLPNMIAEFGLSSARNELFTSNDVPLVTKMMAISSDVVLSGIGLGVMNKILPSNQIKEFQNYIDSIDDPVTKETITKTLKHMEDLGIDNLSYGARDKILKNMLEGKIMDDKTLSAAITSELQSASKASQAYKQALYSEANKIADTTQPIAMSEMLNNFNAFDSGSAFGKETQLAVKDAFIKDIKNRPPMNAKALEEQIGAYKADLRAHAKDELKAPYSAIVKFLQDEQDKLLAKSGLSGTYDAARKAEKEHLALFTGRKVAGEYGQSTGAKISKAINQPEYYGVNQSIFTGTLSPNAANVYVNKIKGDMATREASVFNLITNNVEDISSAGGINTIVQNYSKLNKDGVKIMLGENGAKQLETNMNALTIISQNIGDLEKIDKGLSKEIVNLAGAVMAFKISPYASVHVAINTAKDIANKISMRNGVSKEKSQLSKKLAEYAKDNPAVKQVLKGVMMISVPANTPWTTEKQKREQYKIEP